MGSAGEKRRRSGNRLLAVIGVERRLISGGRVGLSLQGRKFEKGGGAAERETKGARETAIGQKKVGIKGSRVTSNLLRGVGLEKKEKHN